MVLPLLLLTSCFEVIEEVNLSSHTTGQYILTLNLSQSKTQIDKIRLQDSILNYPVPKQNTIDQKLSELTQVLKASKNISNIAIQKDYSNYVFSISFTFGSIEALNTAINSVRKKFDRAYQNPKTYYSISNEVFIKKTDKEELANLYKQMGSKEKDVFKEANYTFILRNPTPIKSYTNNSYKLSKNQTAVFYKSSILNILNKTSNPANSITLSK